MRITKLICLSALILSTVSNASAQDELAKRASWSAPDQGAVRAKVLNLLTKRKLDDATKLKIEVLWPDSNASKVAPDVLLDQVGATLAILDKSCKSVVDLCRSDQKAKAETKLSALNDKKLPQFARNNLRLIYGRWLADQKLYDEAMGQLAALKPADVVDPATLLFLKCVTTHHLLKKKDCLKNIGQLLENETKIPRRYSALAKLMEADIKPLKTDSLDEIARMMNDIRRRLELGRAGKRVQKKEDEVIAKLDKLIEKLEKQRKQQERQVLSNQQSQNNNPSNPMQDSNPGGGKGPGNVDPKRLGSKSGWGNLPPKERQEALQQISKELPAHYREVIEEYFRKLAKDGVN